MRKLLMIRRISGASMVPLLRPGMVVVATGWFGKLHPTDVLIIKHDGLEKIKRLSKIEDGKIFVLGDNPDDSTDSRQFGWLPVAAVQGKVLQIINK